MVQPENNAAAESAEPMLVTEDMRATPAETLISCPHIRNFDLPPCGIMVEAVAPLVNKQCANCAPAPDPEPS